jgi:DNA-binding GntR family transcriptional regulator
VVWGRRRDTGLGPDFKHHRFAEHDAIFAAIADRNTELAAERMCKHLVTVGRNLFGSMDAGA